MFFGVLAALADYVARGFAVDREIPHDEDMTDDDDPIWSSPGQYRSSRAAFPTSRENSNCVDLPLSPSYDDDHNSVTSSLLSRAHLPRVRQARPVSDEMMTESLFRLRICRKKVADRRIRSSSEHFGLRTHHR